MDFELNIENIGKLTDAKICVGQFTVLAGPNNTGKSYVSKLLYSLFDAMNANHAEVYINNLVNPLFTSLNFLEGHSEEVDTLLSPLRKEAEALHGLVMEAPAGDFEKLNKIIPKLVEKVGNMQAMFPGIRSSMKLLEEDEEEVSIFPVSLVNDASDNLEWSLRDLEEKIGEMNATDFVTSGIEYKIRENLIHNFQVPKLSDLRGKENARSKVEIENFGKFEFSNGEIKFRINRAWLREFQQFSNVIYLESPVYWKLKNALEDLRGHSRYLSRKMGGLSGVPQYFYDLASALRYEYTRDIAFPSLYKRLIGEEVIGGKIAISESGDLSFQENGRSFSLPVTAMGVTSLGILALLIERKVLNEKSFIFIDEPEAHLHPAWQVIIAETLFDLAKGGVNVVIATHSADILKWLEVHVKKNPDDESLIALNKLPVNGDEIHEQDFSDKMAAIKQDLTKPFADLYTAGL